MPARKRAADYTGQQTAKLQELRKADIVEASQRIALVNAEQQAAKEEIIDYTGGQAELPEVEVRQAEVNTPFRVIRVNQDIDQMTYGRKVPDPGDYDNPDMSLRRPAVMGPLNEYNFKEGHMYTVPKEVAEHLDAKGYISYMGRV